MKRSIRITALTVALAAPYLVAHAQSGATREQVTNELAEAIRSGDIISGESGLTLREQFPGRYPQAPKPPGRTRAQVQAELADAIRNGEVIAGGEIGSPGVQGIPGAFPRELMVGQKTRAEVQQELAEAIRTGDMLAGGESAQLLRLQNPAHYTQLAGRKPGAAADRVASTPMR